MTTATALTVLAAALHRKQQELLLHHRGEHNPMALDAVVESYANSWSEPVHSWERTGHLVWKVVCQMPVTVIFGIFTGLCAWSLLSLLLYHGRAISIAQTTNERVRGVFSSSSRRGLGQGGGSRSPADQGCGRNWWNCLRTFYYDRPASRLPPDFSEKVSEGQRVAETVWSGEMHQSLTTTLTPVPTQNNNNGNTLHNGGSQASLI